MKKYEKAATDYQNGMTLAEIADKYQVSVSTVRSWKSRHWHQNFATKTQRVAKSVAKNATPKPTEKAIEELSDSELTDKQKAFVVEFLRTSNATQAYIIAYNSTYQTAKTNGSVLLTNTNIQQEIKRLRAAKFKELSVGVFDLLEDLAIEARADIGDYVEFGYTNETQYELDEDGRPNKNKPLLDDDGNPVVYHRSWAQFKDKSTVNTKAIKSIRMGKDGPVVELHDRNKARDKLLELMGDYVKDEVAEDGLINAIKQSSNVFGEGDGIQT